MKHRFFLSFLTAVLVVSIPLMPVKAQEPTPSDDRVNALAREMYCPVCENTPLDVCPTKACAQWRELIREKMNAGWTDQQIKDYFAQQYGDRVLAEPPGLKTNMMVFILPTILLLGTAFIMYVIQKKNKKRGETLAGTPSGLTDTGYLERVEDELERFKKG